MVIQATATVDGALKPATAAVQVVPSAHGRIALGIDPGGAVGWVDITDPVAGTTATFVASGPTVLRSRILDAGTYVVTADAGVAVAGTLVDGIWDGTVQFDGGTPARSAPVPVKPNLESTVVVQFALRGGQGRMWVPAGDAIRGYTETELLVDHASETGVSVSGARAAAFDADGNLWATFSDGARMYTPDTLASGGTTAAKTVALAGATGIAIRGDTVAVASCSGTNGGVSTFSRSAAAPTPTATGISVGCIWGISYDVGNNGKLWVVSKSGSKVYRFTANFTLDLAGVSFTDAHGIAVDASGNAWVSSCSGNSVQQISPTGSLVGSALALPDFACPGGLAFDKQGNLWVLSAGTGPNARREPRLGHRRQRPGPAELAGAGDVRRDRLRPRRGGAAGPPVALSGRRSRGPRGRASPDGSGPRPRPPGRPPFRGARRRRAGPGALAGAAPGR